MIRKIYIFALLAILLMGCQSSITVLPTSKATPQNNTAYPGPDTARTAYPADPKSSFPAELPKNLEPASNQVGTVRGRLVHTSQKSNELFPATYLGVMKSDKNGNPILVALDKANDPKAVIDQKGNFVFLNIKPGQYILMVDLVESLVSKTENGKEQIINVVGGKLLDIGEVPIP